ncbi:hypothetical protein HDV05_004750 [Chytridiales sp. JEL 0842]|nr:hypothetical protein HDV05_004750 [Chytridiales sp. JEL 0842]
MSGHFFVPISHRMLTDMHLLSPMLLLVASLMPQFIALPYPQFPNQTRDTENATVIIPSIQAIPLVPGAPFLGLSSFVANRTDSPSLDRRQLGSANDTPLGRPLGHALLDHQNPLRSRGGKVLTGQIDIYIIWYGSFKTSQKATIIDFFNGISQTSYWSAMTPKNGPNGNVTGPVGVGATFEDSGYSIGKNLDSETVGGLVKNVVERGGLPKSERGVYLVLSDENVKEGKFCAPDGYCGYHSYNTFTDSTPFLFSFVGNPNQDDTCRKSCSLEYFKDSFAGFSSPYPNGDLGIDSMIGVAVHQLSGAASNPWNDGWMDANGWEDGDKCAWNYGSNVRITPSGEFYNLLFGSRRYLTQTIWDVTRNNCNDLTSNYTHPPNVYVPPLKYPAVGGICDMLLQRGRILRNKETINNHTATYNNISTTSNFHLAYGRI